MLVDKATEAGTVVDVAGRMLDESGRVLDELATTTSGVVDVAGAETTADDESGLVEVETATEAEMTTEEGSGCVEVDELTGADEESGMVEVEVVGMTTEEDATELEARTVEVSAGFVVVAVAETLSEREALAETLARVEEAATLESVDDAAVLEATADEVETAELEATVEVGMIGRTVDVALTMALTVDVALATMEDNTGTVELAAAALVEVTFAGTVLLSICQSSRRVEEGKRLTEIQERQSQRVQSCKSTRQRK